MEARRIGEDPLACDDPKLGAGQHAMEYLDMPSEHNPQPTSSCDIVCSFNSLYHVDDVDATVHEIKRVTRSGGLFLLLVEVNHEPTACEPHMLTPRGLIESLQPEFSCESLAIYKPSSGGVYEAIGQGQLVPDPLDAKLPGWLSARFHRQAH